MKQSEPDKKQKAYGENQFCSLRRASRSVWIRLKTQYQTASRLGQVYCCQSVMKASCKPFLLAIAFLPVVAFAQTKSPISLDEFMNASDITDVRIAPDGSAAVVAVSTADWQQNRFNENLWLWNKKDSKLLPLTHSGRDSSPAFSHDGHYIAFLSDRSVAADSDSKDDDKD